MEIDYIVKYLSHFEFSRHTTISNVHELAQDVLKVWFWRRGELLGMLLHLNMAGLFKNCIVRFLYSMSIFLSGWRKVC